MTCLFTQVSSVQHCSVDRSIKYYQLATKNITEYNNKVNQSISSFSSSLYWLEVEMQENDLLIDIDVQK